MEHAKLQASHTPVSANVSSTTTSAASIQPHRPRLNLNNFILVPAGSTNILTNNGQMSNIIATNHNTIVNKGKIMILTTTPTLAGNATGTATTDAGNTAQLLTPHSAPSIHLRPSMLLAPNTNPTAATMVTPNMTSFGNTTTATSIIANIKMNPVSNQPISNQIHQIASIPAAVTATGTIPATVIAASSGTNNFKHQQQQQTMQMLTPIDITNCNSTNSNNRGHVHHQHLNFVSQNLTHRPPASLINNNLSNNVVVQSKHKANKHNTTSTTNSSISTPVILNSSNLFVSNIDHNQQQQQQQQSRNHQTKNKPIINLNLIPSNDFTFNQSKVITGNVQPMNIDYSNNNNNNNNDNKDDDIEIQSINDDNADKNKNLHEKLFTDETLDRSSPELWPETVPGITKFLANTSPSYSTDDDDDELSNESLKKNCSTNDKNNLSGTRNPTLINLSAVVKREILDDENDNDDDDDDEDEEDDDDLSLQNYGDNNFNNRTYIYPLQQQQHKMIKSFSITPYGLESVNDNNNEADDESDSRATSPIDNVSINNSLNNNHKIKSNNNKNDNNNDKPEWQKEFDDEELSMLYGYGSMTVSALLEKVKEIQNLAYQLGLEEESEVARARYLNILNNDNDIIDDHTNLANLMIDSDIDDIFMSISTKNSSSLFN